MSLTMYLIPSFESHPSYLFPKLQIMYICLPLLPILGEPLYYIPRECFLVVSACYKFVLGEVLSFVCHS